MLWGDPRSRQKEIRATVSRSPFFDLERNQNVDVTQLPQALVSVEQTRRSRSPVTAALPGRASIRPIAKADHRNGRRPLARASTR